jgi:hypothetical protein
MKIEEVESLEEPRVEPARRMKIEEVDSLAGAAEMASAESAPAKANEAAPLPGQEEKKASQPAASQSNGHVAAQPALPTPSKPKPIPPPPTTMLDFERDWRSLRKDLESLYLYFKVRYLAFFDLDGGF